MVDALAEAARPSTAALRADGLIKRGVKAGSSGGDESHLM